MFSWWGVGPVVWTVESSGFVVDKAFYNIINIRGIAWLLKWPHVVAQCYRNRCMLAHSVKTIL